MKSRILPALALCLLTVAVAPGWVAEAAPQRVTVGQRPPTLSGTRLSGQDPVDLGALRGRVVVLQFWATWCGPCQAVMPVLDNLHQRYRAQGLSVLGMSSEPANRIRDHLTRRPVGYTIAADSRGASSRRYRVRSLPTIIVLDRAGTAREVHTGLGRIRSLETTLQRLLAEPAP